MVGKIVAVVNLKGGVGKTTACVSIASAIAQKHNVVLIDADPQGSATAWSAAGHLPAKVIAMALQEETKPAVATWLNRVAALRDASRFVLIDCPPSLGGIATAALSIADAAIVPCQASGLDLQAAAKTVALLRSARKIRKDGKPHGLLIPSRVDRRTAAGREIEAALSDLGEPVAPAIAQRTAHADAFTAGQWIGEYAPRSAAHTEILAIAALVERTANR